MYSFVRSGVHPGLGKVTLKYALAECVSNGPGGSIDACVVARMNGGVSSSVGSTVLGIVMM